jgi:hypothetical protein
MSYQGLITDQTLWDMRDIAENLDVQYQTVKSWRRDESRASRAQGNQPHPNLLPPPTEVKSGKPLWHAGGVRLWAMQTGRMTNDGTPRKSKPRGRPRGVKGTPGATARAAA